MLKRLYQFKITLLKQAREKNVTNLTTNNASNLLIETCLKKVAYSLRNEELLRKVYSYRAGDEWNGFEIFNTPNQTWRTVSISIDRQPCSRSTLISSGATPGTAQCNAPWEDMYPFLVLKTSREILYHLIKYVWTRVKYDCFLRFYSYRM